MGAQTHHLTPRQGGPVKRQLRHDSPHGLAQPNTASPWEHLFPPVTGEEGGLGREPFSNPSVLVAAAFNESVVQ